MPSAEIFTALGNAAKAFSEVVGMYFAQLIYPAGDPHKAIAVEFVAGTSERQMQSVFKALAKEARHLFQDRNTDFVATSNSVGEAIAKGGQKFYGS